MRAWPCLALAMASGCTAEPTSSLNALMLVFGSETTLQVAVMIEDVNTADDVTDGDRFTAKFRDAEVVLAFTSGQWQGTFDLDRPPVADETVEVALARDGEDDAPSSTVTVPPVFELEAVPLFISRSKPVTLAWSPASDDTMTWSVYSICANGHGEIAPGATSLTLVESDWAANDRTICASDLSLERVREGQIDPHLSKRSRIDFRWQQSIPFASTP